MDFREPSPETEATLDDIIISHLADKHGVDEEDIRCWLENYYDNDECALCCMIDQCEQINEIEIG